MGHCSTMAGNNRHHSPANGVFAITRQIGKTEGYT